MFKQLTFDIKQQLRMSQELAMPMLFFAIVISIFPLAISPDKKILQMMGPGIIWIAALLASLLSLNRLYQADYEDGTLEQILLSPSSLTLITLNKTLSYWLTTCLPLIIAAPLLAILLGLEPKIYLTLIATLLLGTPVLSLIGNFCSALTVGLKRTTALTALLVIPLMVPVVILGTSTVNIVQEDMSPDGLFALMAALLIGSFTLLPWLTSIALRISYGD